MGKYILRRVLYAIPIAFGVSVVCFSLVYIAPGDPLQTVMPPDTTADTIAIVKRNAVSAALLAGRNVVQLREGALALNLAIGLDVVGEHGIANRVIDDQRFAVERQGQSVRPPDRAVE